ncbi:MAG: hypothetical protein LAP40_24720 [Acidobacteriia bacterium]|nr:hypothetical protein [Terriglobia bacterium]
MHLHQNVYSADTFNNLTDTYEYDYGDTTGSPGPLLKHVHTNYVTDSGYTQTPVHLESLVSSQTIDGGGAVLSQTQYCHDEATPSGGTASIPSCGAAGSQRGNATTVQRWRNIDGLWLNTATKYDANGNPISVQTPLGHTTTSTYTVSV